MMRITTKKYNNRMWKVILTPACLLLEIGRRNVTLWF
jgi:hypothetical protein